MAIVRRSKHSQDFSLILTTMWSNFHTHSKYCDGKGELTEYCLAAKKLALFSLGFSSHAPVPFQSAWNMKPEVLSNYLDVIQQLRQESQDLEIYKGLEIDFIPGIISPNDFRDRLDYTIGSIHFVDALPDGHHWEIDGPHPAFLEGFKTIFKNDIRATVTRYFELTRQMVTTSCPTLVGHLDKVKIQNTGDKLFNESDSWYREEIEKTLDLIQDAGCIVEVNTRGLYQKKSQTPYPSPWILELLLQKGIPVTLSSDAHYPDDLINQFAETALLLRKLGFKKITTLKDGEWTQVDFNENGIALEHSRI